MATVSLYRRYRPRRFSEVKGQEHVVLALRNAVEANRVGQAYLFSGPRGTGKTSSARILAKVLNCANPQGGEPCCECASCLAVEAGTSFDVHELDAASNNGVDAMRDLIEKTMLGTPGRHKVYILDEVHMLSKAAEAALLKTLEEPPPHVVFVLATTDPQKVSETIRSRTQHLEFHLLPSGVLDEHVRWMIDDAGLTVEPEAVDAIVRQGGGSARDTISALELVAAAGGATPQEVPLDEFVESLIESDPGRALAAVAAAIRQGRDPRTLTESLLAHLRDCFLSLMAPELVDLPDRRAEEVAALAQRLGAAAAVRAMETLGTILVEMRHAPDPRVLLEVALVKLTKPATDAGAGALALRVEKLERALASGAGVGAPVSVPTAVPAPAAATHAAATPDVAAPDVATPARPSRAAQPVGAAADTADGTPTAPARAALGSRANAPRPPAAPVAPPDAPQPPDEMRPPAATTAESSTAAAPTGAGAPATAPERPAAGADTGSIEGAWPSVLQALKPIARARLAAGHVASGGDGDSVRIAFPSNPMVARAEEVRPEIEVALRSTLGRSVRVELVVGDGPADAAAAPAPQLSDEHEVDLDQLVDAPKVEPTSGVDRLTAAFPGATLVDEEP